MQIKAKSTRSEKVEADLLVILVSEEWEQELQSLNKLLHNQLFPYLKADTFKGSEGKLYSFPTIGKLPVKTILLAGIGKKNDFSLYSLRKVMAQLARSAKNSGKKLVAIDIGDFLPKISADTVFQVATEGVVLGSYHYTKYKSESKKEPKEIDEVWFVTSPSKIQHASNGIRLGQLFAEGTIFARDLINESPTVTTPAYLANVAKNIGKQEGVTVEVMDEAQVRKMGMESYLAVARGSSESPKFIKLTYKGGGKKKVVIAGKGITFDTGGLSLKDAKNMETMKLDMSGAAAVLGLFKVLPDLKPRATVIGLIAATENMPGSKATKPGDIVTAMNGKSIEILNTDAEGRLTLADVLSYAVHEKPDYIVDLATLTGACMVALGEEIAGLFVNNKDLKEKLLQASREAGEKLWELPLEKEYKENIKSHIADLRNIATTRYGGAITAALFLEEFVETVPWAHLDIAGPAFEEKDTPVAAKGGVGFGVRTLLNFLKNL